jgi:uncharacterized membrane protein (UPF0182 family)
MRIGTIIALLAIVFIVITVLADLYVDWLWFDSLGQGSVYATVLAWRVGLFLAGAVLTAAIVGGNYVLARRLAPTRPPLFTIESGAWHRAASFNRGAVERTLGLTALAATSLGAIIFGVALAAQWDTLVRALWAQPFGIRDPIFGEDAATYVFIVPMLRLAADTLLLVLLVAYAVVLPLYAFRVLGFNLQLLRFDFALPRGVRVHLALGLALFFLLMAARYRLDMYDVLLDQSGLVPGATYSDVHALIPGLWLVIVVLLAGAIISLLMVRSRNLRLLLYPLVGWPVAVIVGTTIYPAAVQQFQVLPSELERERPYIQHAITMTRQAYGLDRVVEQPFPAAPEVTADAIAANAVTVENIRLWDHRPLLDTYNQIQSIRQYYEFHDVDVDRYVINGRYRQVMLAARELSRERLAAQAQTWVNQRLQFTHGYGIVMSPVNEVVGEGLPQLIISNIPPTVSTIPPTDELRVERPQIYFGERTTGYVIVGTREQEFDYPSEEGNVFTTYAGRDGVSLGSIWRRLLFAWHLSDGNILLSTSLTPESRILFRRTVRERIRALAPFLLYDNDPYIVLANGRLVWMQDAYTVTNRFPYAASYGRRLNYIRNSVKVVLDAYDGTVHFYVAEPQDPIIQVYQRAFPTLFRPLADMPEHLQQHVRYPEDLFRIQAEILRMYHMTDPQVLYNREDVWSIPREVFLDQPIDMQPYYVIMRLPGERREEFIIMLPFTPQNRDNMIAWLAARSDRPHYGQMLLFTYPKDRLVFGPMQIEARINQDPTISAQLALWQQRGSRVLRGNLLVVPIGDSNLYVEPLYLLAERGQIPELQRVIVATGNRIVMAPNLGQAMAQLITGRAPAQAGAPPPTAPAAGTTPPAAPRDGADGRVAELARSANEHYARAQEALRNGDWARYGEELRALGSVLRELVALTSGS